MKNVVIFVASSSVRLIIIIFSTTAAPLALELLCYINRQPVLKSAFSLSIPLSLFRTNNCAGCSFQSAAPFPQINGKSISFDEQTVHRLSVDPPHRPIQSRSFDAVTSHVLADQLSVSQAQHQHCTSDLLLHSLSSDSGLHTEKTSEMSSGDFTSKLEDEQEVTSSPTVEENTGKDCDISKPTPVRLSRVGSVKSRVNIFQHLDNKQNSTVPATTMTTNATDSRRPLPKKRTLMVVVLGRDRTQEDVISVCPACALDERLIANSIFSVCE